MVQKSFPGIPICYAMKSNAFLLHSVPEEIQHIEVCSPGELKICERLGISPSKILYSGVMKEKADIAEALRYGVDLITAESITQFQTICRVAADFAVKGGSSGKTVAVLLRLTSGNQFGMSCEDIGKIFRDVQLKPSIGSYTSISDKESLDYGRNIPACLKIVGLHFYSGTAKRKAAQVQKDLNQLEQALVRLKEKYGFVPKLVEYGPGLAVSYFASGQTKKSEEDNLPDGTRVNQQSNDQAADSELLRAVVPFIQDFSASYPLSLEFGRFLSATAGKYYTSVKDLKENGGTHYCICDGGIHQLKYYGQLMAMQVPHIEVVRQNGKSDKGTMEKNSPMMHYSICGSLCTAADVLVRDVTLPELQIGDILVFDRCGAYSATEASALFLSRQLPAVYLKTDEGIELLRPMMDTQQWNA